MEQARQREPGYRVVPRPQRKAAAAQPGSLQEVLWGWEGERGRRRECESRALGCGVCTGARRRRGETGVKGLVSGQARPATSPGESARAAGETLRWRLRNVGGGEERTRSGKGRDARSHRTHARRAPPARWLGRFAATARPAPTVRTLGEEEPPRPPRDSRPPKACGGPLEGTGGHLFLLWGGSGTQDPDACRLPPLPHEERGGRAWACYGDSAPGFPAHFNSVSASSARRFTPPGAPEPWAGTRCATPSHPPGTESGLSDLSAFKSPRPGLHSLSLRGSDRGRPRRLESGSLTSTRGGTT